MHNIDIDLVEMTLDVMKYAINRITNVSPDLGKPMKEEELKALAGETITADGIGGEKAFRLFRDGIRRMNRRVMNPMQLRETTIHPDTRRLVQLFIEPNDDTSGILDMLLAKKRAADRRAWLQEKGDLAEV